MKKCDILIFAPHPDDEALGCSGLINNNVQNKKEVRVVIVTNRESSVDGTEIFKHNISYPNPYSR